MTKFIEVHDITHGKSIILNIYYITDIMPLKTLNARIFFSDESKMDDMDVKEGYLDLVRKLANGGCFL